MTHTGKFRIWEDSDPAPVTVEKRLEAAEALLELLISLQPVAEKYLANDELTELTPIYHHLGSIACALNFKMEVTGVTGEVAAPRI